MGRFSRRGGIYISKHHILQHCTHIYRGQRYSITEGGEGGKGASRFDAQFGVLGAGGLAARNCGTVSNSYSSGSVTGNTTVQMRDISTFVGAQCDMIAVDAGETNLPYTWNIVDAQTYPFLSWQSLPQSDWDGEAEASPSLVSQQMHDPEWSHLMQVKRGNPLEPARFFAPTRQGSVGQ